MGDAAQKVRTSARGSGLNAPVAWTLTALTDKHLAEIALAVERARAQWLKGGDSPSPAQVVSQLERVLLFLRQNGSPTNQSRHVTSLALTFADAVRQANGWKWMSVSDDGSLNPSLVSLDDRHAFLPVDAVTRLLMQDPGVPSLPKLFRTLTEPLAAGDEPLRIYP